MAIIRYATVIYVLFSVHNVTAAQSAHRPFSFPLYTQFRVESDIQYGQSVGVNDSIVNLLLDVYTGEGDTTQQRPLIIFIHGGGFRNGHKSLKMNAMFCSHFAKCGYVAASIKYRLTQNKMKSNDEYFLAMLRAVQDAKAAVRFFKKYGQKYGIDTAKIFVMGSSAGAITALHLAYLDQNEIPPSIDVKTIGLLDGNSGNSGYSSAIHGVINCWGAMADLRWIQNGNVPVFNIHGVNDSTIAFDSSFSYKAFKYGSTAIHDRALKVGIKSGLRLFYQTGHTLDNDPVKLDSAANDITEWLSTVILKN